MTHYAETQYGFEYGAAKVERLRSDEKKGWVLMRIETPRECLDVYVTKTGKVRVDVTRGREWKRHDRS